VLGAYPTGFDQPVGEAPPLPPVNVTLGGQRFAVDPDCLNVLVAAADDSPDARADPSKSLRYRLIDSGRLERMTGSCPQLPAALTQTLGVPPQNDPGRFWPAVGQLADSSFAPTGAAAATGMPPEFCRQAEANMNTCRMRQESMGPVGSRTRGN